MTQLQLSLVKHSSWLSGFDLQQIEESTFLKAVYEL